MDIDVFTLFPEWFAWFGTPRPVRNAIERGTTLTCVNPRDFTTLSGRQVDDTPFGGGAGMVLRVDVMEQALAGHYGVEDAMQVREQLKGRWIDARTLEVLHRGWHVEGQAVRPDHRIVAHTAFLTVARFLGQGSRAMRTDGAHERFGGKRPKR